MTVLLWHLCLDLVSMLQETQVGFLVLNFPVVCMSPYSLHHPPHPSLHVLLTLALACCLLPTLNSFLFLAQQARHFLL